MRSSHSRSPIDHPSNGSKSQIFGQLRNLFLLCFFGVIVLLKKFFQIGNVIFVKIQILSNIQKWAHMAHDLWVDILYGVGAIVLSWPALFVPPPMIKLFSPIEMAKSEAIWEKSAA
jgi:hypothetical protein